MSRILIVEDEKRIAIFLEKGLQRSGFSTTIASDGEQALQVMQQEAYDAILLDLGLPVKDGWAVLRELRNQGDKCPVILVTAVQASRKAALLAGANDCVAKPFRFKELLTAINKQLGQES